MNLSIHEVLTPQEIQAYKQQGFSEGKLQQMVGDIEKDPTMQTPTNTINPAQSLFSAPVSENLIKWQLELDSILERVEHILRGDKPKFVKGNIMWVTAEEPKERMFNDYGVTEIMCILYMYLNRNTILSNYSEDIINEKMIDFGYEITDLIYLKYESMGLDTLEKRKRYPIVIRIIVDAVHSSYLRSLHGGERQSLREARTVQQAESLAGTGQGLTINNMGQGRKERGLLNPARYIKGKY